MWGFKMQLNPNWHELRKKEKCSSLAPPWSKVYKTQWSWQDVKVTQLMSIFTSKKVWNFLIQIQLIKSNPKITRGVKLPWLMPIRVKKQKYILHINKLFEYPTRILIVLMEKVVGADGIFSIQNSDQRSWQQKLIIF